MTALTQITGKLTYNSGATVAVLGKPSGRKTPSGLAIWTVTTLTGASLPGSAAEVTAYQFNMLPGLASIQVQFASHRHEEPDEQP